MAEDERLSALRSQLFDYLKSPSLRHIRDPHSVAKLAKELLRAVDRPVGPWSKWDGLRDAQLTAAATTWIPAQDLRDYLNTIPGPRLTTTDVEQRLRAIQEGGYFLYPTEQLKEGCLQLDARERDAGTEMSAIIGALQEYVELERDRIRTEHEIRLRETQAAEKEAARQRLLSGADCKWTPLTRSNELFCRTNGRLFRLSQGKDKRWSLFRIATVEDGKGALLGEYGGRGDAAKAVAKIAYQPEPRW